MLTIRHRLSLQKECISLHSTPLLARSSGHALGMSPESITSTTEEVQEVKAESSKVAEDTQGLLHSGSALAAVSDFVVHSHSNAHASHAHTSQGQCDQMPNA